MRRLGAFLLLAGAAALTGCFEFGDTNESAVGPKTRRTLTIAASGTGRVVSDDARIDCTATNGVVSGACAAVYDSGTVVTLAAASGDFDVGEWGVPGCAPGGPCQLTLHQNATVSATFSPKEVTLTLRLQSPSADDGIMLVRIAGPSILSVEPTTGLESAIAVSTSGASTTARVILIGSLGSGPLAAVRVRGIHASATYTAAVEQAAARTTYARRNLAGYSATLVR